jgi:hypothetical protein
VSVKLVLDGFEEVRAALRTLPDDLHAEADHICEAAANSATTTIRAAYPVVTGNLRDHVYASKFEGGRFVAKWVVKNTAHHAWIYEHGTMARHTAIGANRGAMPAGNVFIPAAIRARRRMWQDLETMLVQNGFLLRGAA